MITLGKVFGIDVRLHMTWFFMLGYMAMSGTSHSVEGIVFNSLYCVLMFASVLLHEFGHAFAANKLGIATPNVTLYPFGGLLRMAEQPKTARQEFLISIAGPLVNVAIAAVMILIGRLVFLPEDLRSAFAGVSKGVYSPLAMFTWMTATNVVLAVFNLVPAFPMDGGRVLRAGLWRFLGLRRASIGAVWVSRVLVVAGGAWSIAHGAFMMLLVCGFVLLGGWAELAAQKDQHDDEGSSP